MRNVPGAESSHHMTGQRKEIIRIEILNLDVESVQPIMTLNVQLSTLRFHIQSAPATFSPRLGTVSLSRPPEDNTASIEVPTPGLITSTSRGVVPHLSGDHTALSEAIRWVHVPFESL